ncbi:YopX family protein [Enterococcus sp.]|uniref:YopX family protein n=1 Tax=Enterococcus sp. TaxID=35783 RepID=UPI00289B0483|nr:YopX family protein [Enterococcus sp.]
MIPKFRAWDRKNKVMRDVKGLIWEETDLIGHCNLIAHCPPRGHEFNEWFTAVLDGSEYQLMQSTGLKDKNGVEIFEGDMVRYTWDMLSDVNATEKGKKVRISKVFWSDWRASWAVGKKSCNNDLFRYARNGNTVEVIGNVWENPELLEQANEN